MAKFLFYYFGDDEAYFKALQSEFKKSTSLELQFKRFFEKDEKKIQSLFIKIYRDKAACVFIDFSKESQDYLHLARIISRTPMSHSVLTVGLVDYLSPAEVLIESIATGVNLTHIKSVETFDVIYDVTKLISAGSIAPPAIANATLAESWEVGLTCKIGYVHTEGLHLETNHKLSIGDRIRLNHHWLAKNIVPSKEVFVTKVSDTNLFYHFKYAVDVEFLFEDEFLPPEGMEEERVQEKLQDREHSIKQGKKKLKNWINDNIEPSHEKKAKIMIIDENFHFYNEQIRSDRYPYTLRCAPPGEKMLEELERLQPQMIVLSLVKVGDKVQEESQDELYNLVKVLKDKFSDTAPFIIIFNSTLSSREQQITLGYSNTLASDAPIDTEVLLKMAEAFAKKVNISGGDANRAFIKKTNVISVCEILFPIKVLKLTESDLVFQSETPLADGSNLHVRHPLDMYLHVQAGKTQGKVPEYSGLIHCMGETQKKDLRRHVNSIFFREHDAKLLLESEEFKNLNEAKRLELLAALKKVEDPKVES